MKPSLPPSIPVVLRWMKPGTQQYAYQGLAVPTELPALPRAGDSLRVSPPKRSAALDSYGELDRQASPVNCVVRAVHFDDRESPHGAHGWVITLYLDPV